VDTLERAATDMRVLARSVADSARIDSEHSPVREADTRARLAAVTRPAGEEPVSDEPDHDARPF